MQVRETKQGRCPRLIKASWQAGPRIRWRPKRPQPPPPPQADRSHERNATWRRDGDEMETGWRAPPGLCPWCSRLTFRLTGCPVGGGEAVGEPMGVVPAGHTDRKRLAKPGKRPYAPW